MITVWRKREWATQIDSVQLDSTRLDSAKWCSVIGMQTKAKFYVSCVVIFLVCSRTSCVCVCVCFFSLFVFTFFFFFFFWIVMKLKSIYDYGYGIDIEISLVALVLFSCCLRLPAAVDDTVVFVCYYDYYVSLSLSPFCLCAFFLLFANEWLSFTQFFLFIWFFRFG